MVGERKENGNHMGKEESIVGDLINFRGLVYAGNTHVSPDHERSAIQKLQYEKWTPMDTNAESGQ